jgi:hypothetical protein
MAHPLLIVDEFEYRPFTESRRRPSGNLKIHAAWKAARAANSRGIAYFAPKLRLGPLGSNLRFL